MPFGSQPTKITTCLMISADGRMFFELVHDPVPNVIEKPIAISGAKTACQALGLPTVRIFKLTNPGEIPVYEEVIEINERISN